jgi:hypothetical protein
MITSLQALRDLFAKHCACRPLDVTRDPADHGHACLPEVLADIQLVLRFDTSSEQARLERYAAVKRCDRYAEGDYSALGTIH